MRISSRVYSSAALLGFPIKDAAAIGIIGAADGPTAIFMANFLRSNYLGAIMVAAYSYMALVPIVQPPVIRALTTTHERRIRMPYHQHTVRRRTKILFPIIITAVCGIVSPRSVALVGFLMFGNLIRVRGMLGFTGTYEGRPISVMGSGMGMPSIGIYSYELFKFYDVENIVRIGSAGSYTDKAKLFDVVLAAGAVSESNYARVQSGFEGDITLPSQSLNDKLRASAAKQGISLIEGNIHSSDVFYRQPSDAKPTYWEKLRDERGCLCVEMESFALFANAQVLGKNAACLLTISDSFVSPEITTAE